MNFESASDFFLYAVITIGVFGLAQAYAHNKWLLMKNKAAKWYERLYSYIFFSIPALASLLLWVIVFLKG